MTQITLKPQQQIEFLKCFYTPEERAELSEKLIRAIALKQEKEEEFKAVKLDFKEAIEQQDLEIKRLSRRLNFGHEHRNVVCDVILNHPVAGKKTILRTDCPGEVVRVLEMDDTEVKESPAPPDKLFETAPEEAKSDATSQPADSEQSNVVATGNEPTERAVADLSASPAPTRVESSTEEQKRTKRERTRKKLMGQDAILPHANKPKQTDVPHGHNVVPEGTV